VEDLFLNRSGRVRCICKSPDCKGADEELIADKRSACMAVPQGNDSFLPSDQLWARVGSLRQVSADERPSRPIRARQQASRDQPTCVGWACLPSSSVFRSRPGLLLAINNPCWGRLSPIDDVWCLGDTQTLLSIVPHPILDVPSYSVCSSGWVVPSPDVFLTGHFSSLVDLSLRSLGPG